MNCVVCKSVVPDEVSVCPRCGDHVEKWRQLDARARAAHEAGAALLEDGQPMGASLAFYQAAVLQPGAAVPLADLAGLLADAGEAEGAAFYYGKALSAAELAGAPADAIAALEEKAAALRQAPAAESERVPVLGLIGFTGTGETNTETPDGAAPVGTANGPREALWRAVLALEARPQRLRAGLAPVLPWLRPASAEAEGPWAYLLALCALIENDQERAVGLFEHSAASDDSLRNADIYLLCLRAAREETAQGVAFLRNAGRDTDSIVEALRIAWKAAESRELRQIARRLAETGRGMTSGA